MPREIMKRKIGELQLQAYLYEKILSIEIFNPELEDRMMHKAILTDKNLAEILKAIFFDVKGFYAHLTKLKEL